MGATRLLPGRYADVRLLARGGMGEVYLAVDTALARPVAIKVLAERYAQDAGVRARFTREAHAAARLSGTPGVVTIFDVGEHEARPFIVMEHLAGGSLEELLAREGAQPPSRALAWLDQAAAALDAAHRAGVVHRDVKPANLLLDRRGQVHVADFGIASAAGLDSLTQTGTVLGTAAYLSPEQAQGRRATPASDRYGLALVAYELFTGRRAFAGGGVAAEAAARLAGPPSVRGADPELPGALDDVLADALAVDPAERPGSCAELVGALREALADARPTQVQLPPPRDGRTRRRLWPVVGLAGLAALGVGFAVAAARDGSGRSSAPTVVRTVTGPTRTVLETVTSPSGPAHPPGPAHRPGGPTAGVAGAAASEDGHALNDQAFARMQRGDFQGALPLLQRAVQALDADPGDPYTGYANFNLGVALVRLGRCAEALPYLQAARQLEPGRHEVDDALRIAQGC